MNDPVVQAAITVVRIKVPSSFLQITDGVVFRMKRDVLFLPRLARNDIE